MATITKKAVMGYLPNENPPFGQMVLLGFQHMLTMFPATVLCAILMKFNVSTVLTITGLGTVIALIGSKLSIGKFIPLYYGSSFSYIAAVTAIMQAKGVTTAEAPPEIIAVVTAGFICTGLINVIVGLIIRFRGRRRCNKGSGACRSGRISPARIVEASRVPQPRRSGASACSAEGRSAT